MNTINDKKLREQLNHVPQIELDDIYVITEAIEEKSLPIDKSPQITYNLAKDIDHEKRKIEDSLQFDPAIEQMDYVLEMDVEDYVLERSQDEIRKELFIKDRFSYMRLTLMGENLIPPVKELIDIQSCVVDVDVDCISAGSDVDKGHELLEEISHMNLILDSEDVGANKPIIIAEDFDVKSVPFEESTDRIYIQIKGTNDGEKSAQIGEFSDKKYEQTTDTTYGEGIIEDLLQMGPVIEQMNHIPELQVELYVLQRTQDELKNELLLIFERSSYAKITSMGETLIPSAIESRVQMVESPDKKYEQTSATTHGERNMEDLPQMGPVIEHLENVPEMTVEDYAVERSEDDLKNELSIFEQCSSAKSTTMGETLSAPANDSESCVVDVDVDCISEASDKDEEDDMKENVLHVDLIIDSEDVGASKPHIVAEDIDMKSVLIEESTDKIYIQSKNTNDGKISAGVKKSPDKKYEQTSATTHGERNMEDLPQMGPVIEQMDHVPEMTVELYVSQRTQDELKNELSIFEQSSSAKITSMGETLSPPAIESRVQIEESPDKKYEQTSATTHGERNMEDLLRMGPVIEQMDHVPEMTVEDYAVERSEDELKNELSIFEQCSSAKLTTMGETLNAPANDNESCADKVDVNCISEATDKDKINALQDETSRKELTSDSETIGVSDLSMGLIQSEKVRSPEKNQEDLNLLKYKMIIDEKEVIPLTSENMSQSLSQSDKLILQYLGSDATSKSNKQYVEYDTSDKLSSGKQPDHADATIKTPLAGNVSFSVEARTRRNLAFTSFRTGRARHTRNRTTPGCSLS